MNLEDLSRMSEAELREKANEKLAKLDLVVEGRRVHLEDGLILTEAQFFIDEIERRAGDAERKRQSRIATRDLILELVVIALIGAELIYAIHGGNQQLDVLQKLNTNAGQQLQLLQTMNANAEQTARALTGLTQQQQTAVTTQQQTLQMVTQMNGSLRTELGLNFKPAVTLVFDESGKRLVFQNVGKTNLFLWGTKTDELRPEMAPEPRVVAPSTNYSIWVGPMWDAESKVLTKGNTDRKRLEMYVKASDQKTYVASFFLVFAWQDEKMLLNVQMIGIEQKDW